MRRLLAILTVAAPVSAVSAVSAQPFEDEALRVEGDKIVVARFSAPNERIGSLAARRLSSRNRADRLARDAIHEFVDAALDAAIAQPDVATRAHALVDSDRVQSEVRPMVDGSAVVELSLPLGELRAIAPLEGTPW